MSQSTLQRYKLFSIPPNFSRIICNYLASLNSIQSPHASHVTWISGRLSQNIKQNHQVCSSYVSPLWLRFFSDRDYTYNKVQRDTGSKRQVHWFTFSSQCTCPRDSLFKIFGYLFLFLESIQFLITSTLTLVSVLGCIKVILQCQE